VQISATEEKFGNPIYHGPSAGDILENECAEIIAGVRRVYAANAV